MSDISNFTTMKLLIYFREQKELRDMTKKLSNLVIEKQEKSIKLLLIGRNLSSEFEFLKLEKTVYGTTNLH